jgi:eukaryotic-like serine/threonine-protein kinase
MPAATERWAEIAACFDELVELAPTARARRLAELASADPALAAEVRALLAADDSGNSLLDADASAAIPDLLTDQDATPGDGMIGPYRLLRLIGEGGMGVVYLAQRSEPGFEQQVALKLLKRGMDSDEVLRRFVQERRILAQLSHPHVARFLDGGVSVNGRPYFAMEFVDGNTLTQFARTHALGLRERVSLLASVCDAVAYAHSRLVVHRDLKPSNILVDTNGQPRVLDFGIAKLLDDSGDAHATATGTRAMSPAYAAPEQILGEPVGTATDVYSLGAVAFELFTGSLPHLRSATSAEALMRELAQETTSRPSQVLRQSVLTRGANIGKVDASRAARELSGDLDTIVLTALQREPQRRYATAAALAEDLRRWLAGRPIAARPDTARYRIAKFVRRHRGGVATFAISLLALLAALGISLWQAHVAQLQARRADAEAASARENAQRSKRVRDFLISVFAQEDPLRHTEGGATTLAQAFDDTLKRIDTELADDPALQGDLLDDFGEITTTKGNFPKAQELFERALVLAERTHAADDPAVAETLVNLGVLADYRGNALEGKPYLQRAVAILEPHARERPGDYGNALAALAKVLHHEGDLREGARILRRVLDLQREAKAPPEALVGALSNVAVAQLSLGQYVEADALASEALELAERSFGKDSPNVIPPLWTLETTAYQRGDLEGEQRLVERRLAIARAKFPATHPWAIAALGESGFMLMRSGQAAEGEARLREALRILAQAHNAGEEVQMIQRRLWLGLRQNGNRSAAQTAIEAAWKNCSTLREEGHKLCLTVRANRAQSLAEAGQGEVALAEADAAAQALKAQLGEHNDELAQALEARASALLALQRREDALAAQRDAATMYAAVYGAEHVATQRARATLDRM